MLPFHGTLSVVFGAENCASVDKKATLTVAQFYVRQLHKSIYKCRFCVS